ncbi:MAG: class I SAM-dependent methyltransferase [Afipia sp.]
MGWNVNLFKRETKMSMGDNVAAALEWAGAQPGWWHDAGNLNVRTLERIVHYLNQVKGTATAETGCGLSTVVLSNAVENHTCFTITAGNSLEKVQGAAPLRHSNVSFVLGPSQMTLPRHTFSKSLDLVLIDGAHAFPFAELDYYFLYPHIRRGGILVIDDIHIPTVGNMYEFLRADKMWKHLENVYFTAFFERTDAPLFDPHGDGWERQRYNAQNFAHKDSLVNILGEKWWER